MIPIEGQPILTVAAMRAAEHAAAPTPAAMYGLMEGAGAGVAEVVRRLAAGTEALILCGPGNNGGDGYVAARVLAENGHAVRVVALEPPRTELATAARAAWHGRVEAWPEGLSGGGLDHPLVVDAVFGIGLDRALGPAVIGPLAALVGRARLSIAVDLPSGLAADTGAELDRHGIPGVDLTLALGALKPAHVLQPGAARCGTVRSLDLGEAFDAALWRGEEERVVETIARPWLTPPEPWSHKYTRGMVAVVAGRMHGAAELAAQAAFRAGAGYVLLLTGGLPRPPHAIVRGPWSAEALGDPRIGTVVIGPGLGRDERAREKLAAALASERALVIDGDALHLLDLETCAARHAPTVLTPHAGEFAALFGEGEASKIVRTQDAARRSGAVVVHKGADTVIAHPDGRATVATRVEPRLAVAGTGDVLAGTIAAMLAQWPRDPLGAASAGVWLHTEAARAIRGPFIADDLVAALPRAVEATTVAR